MSRDDATLRTWVEQGQRDWLDTDGRPLAEVSSALYPADTVEVACPYSGARAGKPMSLTALEQVRAHRSAGLATLASLVGPAPCVADVLAALSAVLVAPLFGARPVPAATAALYKTSLGFHQVLVSLLLDSPGLAATPARDLPGPDALLTVLESGRWLVGQRQVCGGSPADIALYWEVLCGRRGHEGAPLPMGPREWGITNTMLILALVLGAHERLAGGDRAGLVGFGTSTPEVDAWPLGARLWHRRPAPWLVAATARPDRTAAMVERLTASTPIAVATWLSTRRTTHAEDEAAFWIAGR